MRTYSALLLFENVFEFIPTTNADIINLAGSIFTPDLPIVENDCGTTLGKFEIVNFEAEGLVELATDTPLSKDRIEQLLSQGIYELATRHTSTCTSKEGICRACYTATYPTRTVPKVNDRIKISPEYLVNSEVVAIQQNAIIYTTQTDPTTYTLNYAYRNGVLLQENVDYTLINGLLTLLSVPTEDYSLVLHCKIVDTSPFLIWLSNTYSGSLFGMQPLPSEPLPIRSLFLSSLLAENRLQLISDYISQVSTIPRDYSIYSDQIRDPLEKGLFLLALYCIYSNATY